MGRNKVPTLETKRLILRMWNKKDAKALYNYAKNPNVGPHAGWKPHENAAESKMIIKNVFYPNLVWAILDKETGTIIGSIGFDPDNIRQDVPSKELGYSLDENYWGRGIMTEAATELIKYAFENLKLEVLMIRTSNSNIRSQRVIEKCGFKYEGTFRRAYRTYDRSIREMRCYSMLREEYESTWG